MVFSVSAACSVAHYVVNMKRVKHSLNPRWRGLRPFQDFSVCRGEERHAAFPFIGRVHSMRPHLSLDVRNVPASVEFYRKVFWG
jgi:hypothetical protein